MAWGLFAWLDIAQNSKSDPYNHFYFVTGFYSSDNICIADGKASELGIRSFLSSQVFVCEIACE